LPNPKVIPRDNSSCFSLKHSLYVAANPYCHLNPYMFVLLFFMNKQPIFIEKYMSIILKQICYKIIQNQSQISCKTNFSTKSTQTKSGSCALCLTQTSMHLAQEVWAYPGNRRVSAPRAAASMPSTAYRFSNMNFWLKKYWFQGILNSLLIP
jgi:hypothetical protein